MEAEHIQHFRQFLNSILRESISLYSYGELLRLAEGTSLEGELRAVVDDSSGRARLDKFVSL